MLRAAPEWGQEISVGMWAHWQLRESACRPTPAQNREAARRPRMHLAGAAAGLPAPIMPAIWMLMRKELRGAVAHLMAGSAAVGPRLD